jgi:hypothetical protein
MKKYGLNVKLLFADFLEKGTFCSEIDNGISYKSLFSAVFLYFSGSLAALIS